MIEHTVLHVVDRLTGGVPVAVREYISNSPLWARHIILAPYISGRPAPIWDGVEAEMIDLGSNLLAQLLAVQRAVRSRRPDIVHAHSSFPGLLVRILGLPAPVVYSPHCFKFDDPSSSAALRAAVRVVEKMLGGRTDVYAVLSHHEADLARSLSPGARMVRVPNVPSVEHAQRVAPSAVTGRIGMVGRLAPQKDPAFFLEVGSRLRSSVPEARMTWIGDGDDLWRERLNADGVRVTGWLDRVELSEELDQLDLYLHTAAYEGFPLSVLDAAARRIPIIARDIPSLREVGMATFATPAEAASLAERALNDAGYRRTLVDAGSQMLEIMNLETQRMALGDAWSTKGRQQKGR